MKMNKHARKWIGTLVVGVAVVAIVGTVAAAMPAHASTRAKARPATTSFHFTNIPVRSALQLIAEEGNFDLVVSDSVQGTITLHLDDVTCEQALDIVLRMKGLQQRVERKARSVGVARG